MAEFKCSFWWLVELMQPATEMLAPMAYPEQVYLGTVTSEVAFSTTKEAFQAKRFATRQEAEDAIAALASPTFNGGEWYATEHGFCGE